MSEKARATQGPPTNHVLRGSNSASSLLGCTFTTRVPSKLQVGVMFLSLRGTDKNLEQPLHCEGRLSAFSYGSPATFHIALEALTRATCDLQTSPCRTAAPRLSGMEGHTASGGSPFLFLGGGCTCSIWKFRGQGSNGICI